MFLTLMITSAQVVKRQSLLPTTVLLRTTLTPTIRVHDHISPPGSTVNYNVLFLSGQNNLLLGVIYIRSEKLYLGIFQNLVGS